MDSTFDLLLTVLLFGLGIALSRGKCVDLVLGKDPEMRKKYNEDVCIRFFSVLMFVLSACSLVTFIGGQMSITALVVTGIGLSLAVATAGIIYFMKNPKFRK